MWSIQQFKLVYDRFLSSGLSVTDFCANECILQSKFYYWKKKLHEHNQLREKSSDFVPIVFSDSTPQMQTKRKAQQKLLPENADQVAGNVFELFIPILCRLFSPVQIHSYQQKGRFSIKRFLSTMTLLPVMFLK